VAPFSGNIIELCPVGALTSQPYRFRARPWDIEGAAGICTLCPSQCNVEFTVRDERVLRVLERHHPDVDDGWLCDKGRFAYQAIHADERVTRPLVRDGGELREVSWDRAMEVAAGLHRHRGHVGALVGGRATNEEGFLLQRLVREALDSPDIDSRDGGSLTRSFARALATPNLQATFADLEFANAVLVLGCEPLDDAPIFDLRIRKGVRRNGVKLAVATARPSALDPNAELVVRYTPGDEEAFVAELAAELADEPRSNLARFLRDAGEQVVIVWGERLPEGAVEKLLELARTLGLADNDGAGLLEIPAGTNGRGLREAGTLPDSLPGYVQPPASGRSAHEIAQAAASGELSALYLFETDPVRDHPDRDAWEQARHRAALVVAHASVLTDGLREHANVVFPAESHAEKEGTVVHPDGRIQRLRMAIGHPDQVRAGWRVLAELSQRLGLDTGVLTSGMAFAQLVEAVPFYAGVTLEEIGGRGVRWPERVSADALGEEQSIPRADAPLVPPPAEAAGDGRALRVGTYRPIWAAPDVEISPALHFTIARQQLELSPGDAQRLGIADGETVEVQQNGTSLRATAAIRSGVAEGTAFLAEGIATDSANALTGPTIEVVKR
jgi:NADH-quinone oxidoreductase subunit G